MVASVSVAGGVMNVIVADGSRTGSHWGWASLSSMPGMVVGTGIATVTVVDVGDMIVAAVVAG